MNCSITVTITIKWVPFNQCENNCQWMDEKISRRRMILLDISVERWYMYRCRNSITAAALIASLSISNVVMRIYRWVWTGLKVTVDALAVHFPIDAKYQQKRGTWIEWILQMKLLNGMFEWKIIVAAPILYQSVNLIVKANHKLWDFVA